MSDYIWMYKIPDSIDGRRMLNSFYRDDVTKEDESLGVTTRLIKMELR